MYDDVINRQNIFIFLTSTCLVRELCKTCYQYNTLHLDDAKKLFDSAKFELVFVYIYFENRTHVADLGSKSSPMIRGLIESLEKCEITVRFFKIFFFKVFFSDLGPCKVNHNDVFACARSNVDLYLLPRYRSD